MLRRIVSFGLALVVVALLIPSLPALAAVALVTSWHATANSSSTPLSVTTGTTNGDLLVAVYYTQASTCPTLTAASGWTKSADSGCTSTKHDIAIFTHTATGEASDTPLASLSAAANQNVTIYEFTGANTTTPIDVSSFAAMASSTTPATPGITTTKNGDYLIAAWGTSSGKATASSITAGWTQVDNNNAVFQTTGSEAQASAGAVTSPTVAYAAAPTSGVVGSIAIAPAASNPAPTVKSTCVTAPVGQATSDSVGTGCTFTAGDLVVVTVSLDNSVSTPITAPSGWTQIDSFFVSPLQITSFWHVVQAGETTYSFSWGATSLYHALEARDIGGANTTTPIDAFAHNNTTSNLTVTTASVTPTQTDLAIASFSNSHNSSTPTAAAGWTNEFTVGTNASIFLAGQNNSAFSSAGTATATYTGTASPLVVDEIILIAPTAGGTGGGGGVTPQPNYVPLMHAGGKHASIALAGGGGGGVGTGLAPLPDWMTWFNQLFGSNDHISAAHQAAWLDYCNGGGTSTAQTGGDTGGAVITGCPHAYDYTSYNMGEPNLSGSDTDLPWTANFTSSTGRTCPSVGTSGNFWASTGTDAPNWTSTSNSTNWFMYATTIGSNADRIVSYHSTYRLFTNLFSTNMSSAVNAMLQNCAYRGVDLDAYEGWWNDNAYAGLTAANWLPWGPFAYNTAINWGSNGGTLTGGGYASTNCNGSGAAMFNGVICSQATQIAGSSNGGNATYGADVNGVGAITSAWQQFIPSLKHRNGTAFKFMYNDLINGDAACQMNNQIGNVTGGTLEFATSKGAGDGRYQGPNEMLNVLDIAATDNACGGTKFLLLDDFDHTTITGTTANDAVIGTQDYENQKRAHFEMIWLLWNDTHPQMMTSWTLGCGSCTSFTDVWAADFVAPSGRITPYPAEALGAGGAFCGENFSNDAGTNVLCSQGGARDSAIQATCPGGSPNCVFRAEYNHFWVWNATACPSYSRANWNTTCVHDIGPAAVLFNLSGQTVTLSSANLQAWLPNTFTQVTRILTLCTPNASYFGTSGNDLYANQNTTTTVCSSGASDLFNGSTLGSTDLASEIGTTLANNESVVLTAGTP